MASVAEARTFEPAYPPPSYAAPASTTDQGDLVVVEVLFVDPKFLQDGDTYTQLRYGCSLVDLVGLAMDQGHRITQCPDCGGPRIHKKKNPGMKEDDPGVVEGRW